MIFRVVLDDFLGKLRDESFKSRNVDFFASEREQTSRFQAVEGLRNIQSAVVEFVGEARHFDAEKFRPCGSQAALGNEADDSLVEILGLRMPQMALQAMALRGNDVQQVDAENGVFLGEPRHFRLLKRHAVAVGLCRKCARESLGEAENALWLENVGRGHRFGERITVVVGLGSDAQLAIHQETKAVANFPVGNDGFACLKTLKTQLRLACQSGQVGVAQALKQGKLQQSFVDVGHFKGSLGVSGVQEFRR